MTYTDAQIAQVCHEANRTLQTLHVTMGDKSVPVSQPRWSLNDPDREGIIAGVRGVIEGKTPEQSHEAWCEHKIALGWTWGPVKNEVERTHPCLLAYAGLPAEQRRKDHLFAAIVRTLAGPVDGAEIRERWEREAAQVDDAALEPLRAVLQQNAPQIGDRVHYVSYGTPGGEYGRECRAAVVTQVGLIPFRVGLCVLNPSGMFFNEWVDLDGGTYSDAARAAHQGAPDDIGCHERDFRGGTWHRMPD